MSKTKVLLCILDGFSIGDVDYKYNAVFRSNTKTFQRFLKEYPYSMLKTSGISVGLPEGQMGNSEVGHMTIGSGRVIYQDLPKITIAIKNGDLFQNQTIINTLNNLKQTGKSLHLLGLASDGGVHSHIDHIIEIANFFAQNNVLVKLHLITDGRDVAPQSFQNFYEEYIYPKIKDNKNIKPSTLCGRYYAMDRDNKVERTKAYFDLITLGVNTGQSTTFGLECFDNVSQAMNYYYNNNITDEFIKPSVIDKDYYGIRKGDAIFMTNFRSDRVRQIFGMFCGVYRNDVLSKTKNESDFDLSHISDKISMTDYSQEISKVSNVIFSKQNITNTLSQVISENGLKQLHIAETEKYAHVTFFFNGGLEEKFANEDRILIPSPNVARYDTKPEMSLPELTDKLIDSMKSDKYDFIVCNIANGDMVGHTGNFEATKKASEYIDKFLEKIEDHVLNSNSNYVALITADHGNLEEMVDKITTEILTQHTTNDVPFIYLAKKTDISLKKGGLNNIAATVLKILNIKKPEDMDDDLYN